jgi:ferredoxin--NADP+ reductase
MLELNATVIDIIECTPEIRIFRVKPDFAMPNYLSGQFAVLGLPDSDNEGKFINRAYSISSKPNPDYIEFYITLIPTGRFTPKLWKLKKGSRIYMAPRCSGDFTLERIEKNSNIILIGTGTGIAPFVSMVRSSFSCSPIYKFAVIHGVRHSHDLGFKAELEEHASNCKNFHYFPIISRPKDEKSPWEGLCGYVQDVVEKGSLEEAFGEKINPDNTHVFMCGSPNMIEYNVEMFKKLGFTEWSKNNLDGNLHFEKFWV